MRFSPRGRLALTIVLAVYGFRMLTHPEVGWFLDNVDLPIHETGHLVFSPFGEFMQFAGGTLFQLLLPAVFVGYFFRQKDRHGASIALWWVAQNLWNVSVYVKDARALELPLVGGGVSARRAQSATARPGDRARDLARRRRRLFDRDRSWCECDARQDRPGRRARARRRS
jgi:hypothetical protein